MFQVVQNRYGIDGVPVGVKLVTAWPRTEIMKDELVLLAERCRIRFPQLASMIDEAVETAPPYQAQVGLNEQLGAILAWGQNLLQTSLLASNHIWPQGEQVIMSEKLRNRNQSK
jgi:hypothetical protein